jgi:predicted acylesterase/phospholipase RssA
MRGRTFAVLGGILGLCACSGVVSTRILADAFNGGALDSHADPFYSRPRRATDTVYWRMRDEIGEAYFGQGSTKARVVGWLDYLDEHAKDFMFEIISRQLDGDAASSSPGLSERDGPEANVREKPESQKRIQAALDRTTVPVSPGGEPFCDPSQPNHPNAEAIERFADYVRFQVALEAAATNAAQLVRERFASMPETIAGAKRAFHDTATYLANRKWRRDEKHHVTGLVVKGGAATGIFSAGVVYVALNLVNECIKAGKCSPEHSGFMMASGTSTGATIATAVDVFHTLLGEEGARKLAMQKYLDWYLCSSMNDLYCVRNHVLFNLARGDGAQSTDIQDSFLDFDGLAFKAEHAYGCAEMTNPMELILNTVDFRTGRLYSLSDQDPATLGAPWDVAKAVVSSAALPFIVRPTYNLRVDPIDAGHFAYLDGGIRSELPLLALVRRGVERLLVVSSSASVTGDDAPIGNALNMAIRYIDISTGGVTEAEIDHARTRVEASRLAEYEYCRSIIEDDRSAKAGPNPSRTGPLLCSGHCDADFLCAGDFARACSREGNQLHRALSNERIVSQTFQMTSVWRNEDRIAGLPGYSFNPDEQRRLMLAGAETARDQCPQIAAALDINDIDTGTLYQWCTPRLPTTQDQCGAALIAKLQKSPNAPDCPNEVGPTPTQDAGSTNYCPRVR